MNTLKSALAALPLLLLLGAPPAGAAQSSTASVNLFVFNLSADTLVVTYPVNGQPSGETDQVTLPGNSYLNLGTATINESSGAQYELQIADQSAGTTDTFNLAGDDVCRPDPWPLILSPHLFACYDYKEELLDFNGINYQHVNYTEGQSDTICVSGSGSTNLNDEVAVAANEIPDQSCPSSKQAPFAMSGNTSLATVNLSSSSGTGVASRLALGTYVPNGPQLSSYPLPGVSPTNLSLCIGSECDVPPVANWPVTIFFSSNNGQGQFIFNGLSASTSKTMQLSTSTQTSFSQGISVPSYLSNWGAPLTDDAYIPAFAAGDAQSGQSALTPAPCWPTYTGNPPALQNCSGQPVYFGTPPTPGGVTFSQFTHDAVTALANSITIFGVF